MSDVARGVPGPADDGPAGVLSEATATQSPVAEEAERHVAAINVVLNKAEYIATDEEQDAADAAVDWLLAALSAVEARIQRTEEVLREWVAAEDAADASAPVEVKMQSESRVLRAYLAARSVLAAVGADTAKDTAG